MSDNTISSRLPVRVLPKGAQIPNELIRLRRRICCKYDWRDDGWAWSE
jgi:hypothetical protein